MSDTPNDFRRVEVREPGGRVETFVPEQVLRNADADRDALKERLARLESERDSLREELDKTKCERDRYADSLNHVLRPEFPMMTAEELEDLNTNGVSQEELLREINRLFPPESTGA